MSFKKCPKCNAESVYVATWRQPFTLPEEEYKCLGCGHNFRINGTERR